MWEDDGTDWGALTKATQALGLTYTTVTVASPVTQHTMVTPQWNLTTSAPAAWEPVLGLMTSSMCSGVLSVGATSNTLDYITPHLREAEAAKRLAQAAQRRASYARRKARKAQQQADALPQRAISLGGL